MRENKSVHYGIGVLDLLLVLFICLKLTKVIDWPWLWVLCPFWIQFAIAIVIILVVALIGALANEHRHNK